VIQENLFDAALSRAAKEQGIATAEANKASLLAYLRPKAEELYRKLMRPISMDDVVQMMIDLGMSPHALGNSSGGFFQQKKWRWVGATKSTRIWAHNNRIGQYELK